MNSSPTHFVIFFALTQEADALLYNSSIRFIKNSAQYYQSNYHKTTIHLFITGIGPKNTERMIRLNSHHMNQFNPHNSMIIKAGTCAVLMNNYELGKIIIPDQICVEDDEIKLNFSEMPTILIDLLTDTIQSSKLITLNKPLMSTPQSKNLFDQSYQFADMETFTIFSHFPGFPRLPLLVGTDNGTESTRQDFLKNLGTASLLLKNTLIDILKKIVTD